MALHYDVPVLRVANIGPLAKAGAYAVLHTLSQLLVRHQRGVCGSASGGGESEGPAISENGSAGGSTRENGTATAAAQILLHGTSSTMPLSPAGSKVG